MREIPYQTVADAVKQLCIDANCLIGDDIVKAFKDGLKVEQSPTGRDILQQLIDNIEISKKEMIPACQDTGFAVVFLELGSEVHISGGQLYDAINAGVAKGYVDGFLRKSILKDPIRGPNTKDNTPAVIHTEIVPGDKLKITVAPKGGGSENMSEVKMLTPAAGAEGIVNFVVDRVARSKANPCPPVIVGVGIGGTFEMVALLAKKSLLRDIGQRHPDPFYADMERTMLERINKLGIGPQGFGGRITALDVFIEVYPRHIASFPAAVNINCHVARHKSITL